MSRSLRHLWRVVAAMFVGLVLASAYGATPVSAHTDFASSVPADTAVVAEPVSEVTLEFTGEPTPVGDGFTALTPQGELQDPSDVVVLDGTTFVLSFDPPLAGGVAGVRWSVQAPDGHVIEGAISFTVEAPASTTAPPTTAVPTTPATTAPPSTPAPATTDQTAVPAVDTTVAPTTQPEVEVTTTEPAAVEAAPVTGDGDDGSASPTLAEFLDTDDAPPGEATAAIGRLISFPAVVIGLGVMAFAASTLRGRRTEVAATLLAVRVLGAVIAVGAVVEYLGVRELASESFGSTWRTEPGFAVALRVIGGVLLAVGVVATVSRTARPLSAAVVEGRAADELASGPAASPDLVRWTPDRRSFGALVGTVAIVMSFWFDGHTVTRGPRVVHALVDSVHVVAASIWVGGVVVLAVLAWVRHRRNDRGGIARLAVRFSSWATISLVAVATAGAVMAVFVLDSFSDLTGTEWGRLMMIKTAAVAIAAGAGAYNHFALVPHLAADPGDAETARRLRSVLTAEAVVLCAVAVVTAFLVAAATT